MADTRLRGASNTLQKTSRGDGGGTAQWAGPVCAKSVAMGGRTLRIKGNTAYVVTPAVLTRAGFRCAAGEAGFSAVTLLDSGLGRYDEPCQVINASLAETLDVFWNQIRLCESAPRQTSTSPIGPLQLPS
jgi:hypothetical protein